MAKRSRASIFHFRSADFEAALAVPDAAPWSPEAPNLYAAVIELIAEGAAVDAVERVVGFRRFEAREGRLFLNGRPFFMMGALDQDWHPEEGRRPPSAEFLEQRFANAKAMGLNTLRVPRQDSRILVFRSRRSPRADRLARHAVRGVPRGLDARGVARSVLKSVVAHGSHPSIAIWTLFNEGWGIDLDDNPDDRRWLIETFDMAKTLVPDSLVVDNSPCFPRNYHLKTDIEDFHWYNGFPHQNEAFAATARAFAGHAPMDLVATRRRSKTRR